jgi:hypothetical protein
MRKLFTFNVGENPQASIVKDLIEDEGIPCEVRSEPLSMAIGDVPFIDCGPELWIMNDQDYSKAKEALDAWLAPRNEVRDSWACPRCGEKVEGPFTSCWKCGEEDKDAE